ncbi:uncharacterized protein SPPG_03349 [Spizellomyces punctatus DAOM BR117]|uniref:Uncharacterized protein n=1 Tax=Spizellomyces punctatus (strain DAOM BR117) TaxID=645134 RepID=A0A0L0HKI6_SPIPD|nr:uncharacterized protein SPPG_03349 [Spizellomyces punctatus DAOM BR117]KND01548.1 hypothetical protein SPPG_03349 [Spizellomyces punctatus DAOM BR117]|eukprot:XP_016609587.1 hypothetical protein SPPG_03349 [Spizellomyces punctatus DAOM BR117]
MDDPIDNSEENPEQRTVIVGQHSHDTNSAPSESTTVESTPSIPPTDSTAENIDVEHKETEAPLSNTTILRRIEAESAPSNATLDNEGSEKPKRHGRSRSTSVTFQIDSSTAAGRKGRPRTKSDTTVKSKSSNGLVSPPSIISESTLKVPIFDGRHTNDNPIASASGVTDNEGEVESTKIDRVAPEENNVEPDATAELAESPGTSDEVPSAINGPKHSLLPSPVSGEKVKKGRSHTLAHSSLHRSHSDAGKRSSTRTIDKARRPASEVRSEKKVSSSTFGVLIVEPVGPDSTEGGVEVPQGGTSNATPASGVASRFAEHNTRGNEINRISVATTESDNTTERRPSSVTRPRRVSFAESAIAPSEENLSSSCESMGSEKDAQEIGSPETIISEDDHEVPEVNVEVPPALDDAPDSQRLPENETSAHESDNSVASNSTPLQVPDVIEDPPTSSLMETPQLRPSELAPGTTLRVLVAHQASDAEELELEAGDLVELDLTPGSDSEYWWYGTNRSWGPNNGQQGFFPAECVKVETWEGSREISHDAPSIVIASNGISDIPVEVAVPSEPSIYGEVEQSVEDEEKQCVIPTRVPPGTKVTVTHVYERTKADELDLTLGETIVVMEAPEGGWWRGMKNLGGKEAQSGWFPATMIRVDEDELSDKQMQAGGLQSAGASAMQLPTNDSPKRKSWYKRLVVKRSATSNNNNSSSTNDRSTKKNRNRSLSAPPPNASTGGLTVDYDYSMMNRSAEVLGLESVMEGVGESELQLSCSTNDIGAVPHSAPVIVEPRHQRSRSAPPVSIDSSPKQPTSPTAEIPTFMLTDFDQPSLTQSPPQHDSFIPSKDIDVTDLLPSLAIVPPPQNVRLSALISDEAIGKSIRWQDRLADTVLQQMTQKEKQRMTAIFELLTTERDYVRDLKIIIEIFKKPMAERKIVNAKIIDSIFSNIEELLAVSQDFLLRLEQLYANHPIIDRIGNVLLTMMERFVSYTLYCSQHSVSVTKQLSLAQTKREFRVFLEETYKNPTTRQLDLGGFLIKPVQRICKYPLLIKEILKNTEESSADHGLLKEAAERIQGIISIVNEGARQADGVRRVVDIQNNFTDKINIVTPTRHLVREDAVYVNYAEIKKPRRLLLFNDLLIVARKDWRDKYHLVDQAILKDCIIADVQEKEQDAATNLLELEINPSSDSHLAISSRYLFSVSSPQVKQAWLDAYRSLTPANIPIRSKQLSEAGSIISNLDLVEDEEDVVVVTEDTAKRRASEVAARQAAKERVTELEARCDREGKRAMEAERALEAENAKIEELTSKLDTMEKKAIEAETRAAELSSKLSDTIAARTAVEKARDEAMERLTAQEATLLAGGRRIAELEKENKELGVSREGGHQRVKMLTDEMIRLNETIHNLRSDMEREENKRMVMEREKSAELAQAQKRFEDEISQVQKSFEGVFEREKTEKEELRAAIASISSRHAAELQSTREDAEAQIRKTRQEAELSLTRLREENDAALRRIREENESIIGRMREDSDAKIQFLQASLDQEIQNHEMTRRDMEQDKSIQVQRLTIELDSMKQKAVQVTEGLKRSLAEAQEKLREREAAFRAREDAFREKEVEGAKLEFERNQHAFELARVHAAVEAGKNEQRAMVANFEKVMQERHQTLTRKEAELAEISRKLTESTQLNISLQAEIDKGRYEANERRRIAEESATRLKEELAAIKAERVREQQQYQDLDRAHRDTFKQLETTRSQQAQLSEAHRRLVDENARLKAGLNNHSIQLTQFSQEKHVLQSQLGEAHERIAKFSQDLDSYRAEERVSKETIQRLQDEVYRLVVRAERAEVQVTELERIRTTNEREYAESRQAFQAEIVTMKTRMQKAEDEARAKLEKEVAEARRQGLADSQNERQRLLKENEELRAKLQRETADLRLLRDRDTEEIRGRLELVERLESETKTAKGRLEHENEALRDKIGRIEAEFREKAKAASSFKKRARQLEAENESMAQKIQELSAAWDELDARHRHLEGLHRGAEDEINQLRGRLSAAERDAAAVQNRLELYNELDRKYLALRDETAKISNSSRSYEQEMRKAQLIAARKGRELAGLQMVMAEIAKAMSLSQGMVKTPFGGLTPNTYVAPDTSSHLVLHGSSEALNTAGTPFDISSQLTHVDDSRIMAILTRIHDMALENDRLRGDLELERAKQQELQELRTLAEQERDAIVATLKKLEGKLKDRTAAHREQLQRVSTSSERLAKSVEDLGRDKSALEKALQEGKDKISSLEQDKAQLERQFVTLFERMEMLQAAHGKELARLRAQNAGLSKEVELITVTRNEALRKAEDASEKMKEAELERTHLKHLAESLSETKQKTQVLLETANATSRQLAEELARCKAELGAVRAKWEEINSRSADAERRLNSQKVALERGVIDLASAGDELERRSQVVAVHRSMLEETQVEFERVLAGRDAQIESLYSELQAAASREGKLQDQLKTVTGELQWEQIQAEEARSEANNLRAAYKALQAKIVHSDAQVNRNSSRLASLASDLDRDEIEPSTPERRSLTGLLRDESGPSSPLIHSVAGMFRDSPTRMRHDTQSGPDHSVKPALSRKCGQIIEILFACERLLATVSENHSRPETSLRNSVASQQTSVSDSVTSSTFALQQLSYLVTTARQDAAAGALREIRVGLMRAKALVEELADSRTQPDDTRKRLVAIRSPLASGRDLSRRSIDKGRRASMPAAL